MLLEKGADLNIAGEYSGSALGSASAFGHKEVVQILLENGADVNIAGGGRHRLEVTKRSSKCSSRREAM